MNALECSDRVEVSEMFDEPSLWEQMAEMFRGHYRWLNLLALIALLAFAALAVVSAIRFFHADDTRSMIAWAMGFVLGLVVVTAGRMWFWMQIHRNAVVREVRQVRSQLVQLVGRRDRSE